MKNITKCHAFVDTVVIKIRQFCTFKTGTIYYKLFLCANDCDIVKIITSKAQLSLHVFFLVLYFSDKLVSTEVE